MPDTRPLPAANPFAARRMALRAIMDGRGVDAVVLSSPLSLAHYGGVRREGGGPHLLVVTARDAVLVGPGDPGAAFDPWTEAAALLPSTCALGHEDDAADGGGLSALTRVARPRGTLSLSADLARQIAGG